MIDDMPMPNVVTEKEYGNFKLCVFAYRKLTDKEMDQALSKYMIQKRLKRIPTKGVLKVISSIGAIDI